MFKKGRSGNLKGRPKGIIDKRKRYADILRIHGEDVVLKVVEMAKEGDIDAIKIMMDRLVPKAKIESTGILLPQKVDLDNLTKMKCELLQLALDGHIDVDTLEKLSRILEETYQAQALNSEKISETRVTDPVEAAKIYQRFIKS